MRWSPGGSHQVKGPILWDPIPTTAPGAARPNVFGLGVLVASIGDRFIRSWAGFSDSEAWLLP